MAGYYYHIILIQYRNELVAVKRRNSSEMISSPHYTPLWPCPPIPPSRLHPQGGIPPSVGFIPTLIIRAVATRPKQEDQSESGGETTGPESLCPHGVLLLRSWREPSSCHASLRLSLLVYGVGWLPLSSLHCKPIGGSTNSKGYESILRWDRPLRCCLVSLQWHQNPTLTISPIQTHLQIKTALMMILT